MESLYNKYIGPLILFSLFASILMALIIPKTKLSKHLKMSQSFFLITNICGIIVSVAGIFAIFFLATDLVKNYLWKILIMPYVYLQIYTISVMIAKNTSNIYDEKQEFNMTTGAAITFGAMIVIMTFIITPLLTNQILEINLLNPFFLNTSILLFSITTLYLFRKA